jgi:peptidoglycan hydrolase CwlO-like protein
MSPLCRLILRPTLMTFAFALISSTSACVTTGTFDKKVAELNHVRADRDHVAVERDGLRKKLDDATALVGELTARLEKLGQNVGKLTSEKGQLAQGLADARVRLEELRRQTAAAEARAATFRNLVARLKSMIDGPEFPCRGRHGQCAHPHRAIPFELGAFNCSSG